VFELETEKTMRFGGLGEEKEAADFFVEAVDDEEFLPDAVLKGLLDAGPLRVEPLGDRGHSNGLVDENYRVVFRRMFKGTFFWGRF